MSSRKIACKDHYIDAFGKGIHLHMREKRPKGKHRFTPAKTLLMVHGRDLAALVVIDPARAGYFWMDRLARRGGGETPARGRASSSSPQRRRP